MAISIAQLNMLSAHFGFDITEARKLLGLPVTIKSCSNRTDSKSCSIRTDSKRGGRSGYNLYCANSKERLEVTLKSQYGVAKLARGQLQSEMSTRWKKLPDATRELWNHRACNP